MRSFHHAKDLRVMLTCFKVARCMLVVMILADLFQGGQWVVIEFYSRFHAKRWPGRWLGPHSDLLQEGGPGAAGAVNKVVHTFATQPIIAHPPCGTPAWHLPRRFPLEGLGVEATERLHQLYERDRRRDAVRKAKAEAYRQQRRTSSSSRAARLAKYELRRALGVEPGGRTRPEATGQQADWEMRKAQGVRGSHQGREGGTAARLADREPRRALGIEREGRTRSEARGQQGDVAGGLKPTQGAGRRARG